MGQSKGYILMAMGFTMVLLVAVVLMAKPAAAHNVNAPLAQATGTAIATGTMPGGTPMMTGTIAVGTATSTMPAGTPMMTGTIAVGTPTALASATAELGTPTAMVTGTMAMGTPTAMVTGTMAMGTPTAMMSATMAMGTPTMMEASPTAMMAETPTAATGGMVETATPTSNTSGTGVGLPSTGGSTLPTTGSGDGSGILMLFGLLGVALFGIGLVMSRRMKHSVR